MKNSKFTSLIIIFLIFSFAFLLRLIYLFLLKDNPLLQNPILDAKFYDLWARKVANGNWLGEEIFLMSPGYPYLLATFYKIFGHNLFLVASVQLLLGAVNVTLIYTIGKIVFNRSVGIIASFLAAIYGISLFYEGSLLKVVWINFFNLLVLLFIYLGQEKYLPRYSFLAGILLAISALFRPAALLFAPFVMIWILLRLRNREKKQKFSQLTFFVLGIFLVISPITLRNYLISKELILLDAHGGATFYAGNNPESKGTFTELEFVRSDARFEQRDFIKEASRILGRKVTPQEASKFWYWKGLEFIKNEPVKWLKLLLKKFFLFWNAYEYPININYYAAREMIPFFRLPSHQILVRGLPLVGFGLISPLALFGLFLARRKNGQVKLLFFYIFSVLFTNLFFFVASEYRFPAVPILLIFTAYTIYWWFEKIKKREYRSFFISLFTVMILGIGANWKVPPAANTLHYSLGNAYSEKGDYLKAREEYHQALRRAPDFVEVYINLANVYLDLGEFELAEKCLQRAQMLKPDDVGIYNNLGLLNLKQGNYQEAEKFFKKTLEMNSNYGPGYCNLGEMYYTLRRDEEAIKFLEQGLEVDPYPQNYYWLLRIYKETDNDKKAKETFTLGLKKYEEEISRRPEEGDLYSEYALFLLESGLKEEVITSNVNRIFNFAEKGINLRRSPFAYYVLGRVYLLNSQIEQSLHYFTKSLALNPNDAETYLWLGKIYKYWLNESREATDSKAREYFTQGLRINPYYRFLKEEMNN